MRSRSSDEDEMDVQPVNLGDELRQRVQPGLGPAPVVIRSPVADERLQVVQLGTLRLIWHRFGIGPSCRRQTPSKVDDRFFGNIGPERADRRGAGWLVGRDGHVGLLAVGLCPQAWSSRLRVTPVELPGRYPGRYPGAAAAADLISARAGCVSWEISVWAAELPLSGPTRQVRLSARS